jgi:RNA polymerase sigma factor (sigma-70 family)
MNPRPATATAAPAQAPAPTAAAALRFPDSLAGAVERAWRNAVAPGEWNLTRAEFQSALERSAAKRFAGAPADAKKIEAYLDSLHVRDLALAVACSAGNGAAWDFFMAEHRAELYRAARAMCGRTGGEAAARELADSLYAELYGLPADRRAGPRETAGRRKSLFEYFHGRSKLSTWLHAVLAQRHVDELRRARANDPLEDETGQVIAEAETAALRGAGDASAGGDPERASNLAALQAALASALGELDPRDRLRLAYYYADDRTLAEIGRLLGEHEATVSRKLDRTRRDVRSLVEKWLRESKKWNDARLRACLECAAGEWPFDLTAQLRPAGAADASRAPAAVAPDEAARKI